MSRCLATLTLLLALPNLAQAATPSRSYAVVIGSNVAHTSDAAELRFAFADAARMARLLGALTDELRIFGAPGSAPDAEDADIRAVAEPVSVAALRRGLESIGRQLAADRERGIETHLILYYSGHGGFDGGRGYLPLGDARVDSAALLELLNLAPATYTHLLFDACHADAVAREADRAKGHSGAAPLSRRIADRPDIGIITAETRQREALELDRLRGGLLTHYLHSALTGLADADGDRRVSYGEVYRFATAGGMGQGRLSSSMHMRVEPPFGRTELPLVDLRGRPAPAKATSYRTLRLPASAAGRYRSYVNGELYTHWRAEARHAVEFLAPRGGDIEVFRCEACTDRDARQLSLLHLGPDDAADARYLRLAEHGFEPFSVRAFDDWSWGMFPEAYGPSSRERIAVPASARQVSPRTALTDQGAWVEAPPTFTSWPPAPARALSALSWVGGGIAAGGLALLGTGAWARVERDDSANTFLDDPSNTSARGRAQRMHRLSIGLLVTGSLMVAGGVGLALWDSLGFGVEASEDGVALSLSGRH